MPARRKAQLESGDALSTYRAKRTFDQTPEPGGVVPKPGPKQGGLLIVHMHDATRLHWDLLFNLKGYKLRGRWTLIKLKKTEKEWLLIKERDEYVSTEPYSNESVLSGLTNDELRNATQRAEPIKQELEKLGAPKRALRVADTELMLAETREEPFSKDGWIFEVKLDGYRMRAACQDGEPILYSRKGLEYTESFPEIARAVKAIPFAVVILDGELVGLNEAGRPSCNVLQA